MEATRHPPNQDSVGPIWSKTGKNSPNRPNSPNSPRDIMDLTFLGLAWEPALVNYQTTAALRPEDSHT